MNIILNGFVSKFSILLKEVKVLWALHRFTFLTLQPVQQGTILSNSCPRSLSTRSAVKLQNTLHSLKLTSKVV